MRERKVLLLHTGGTLGMTGTPMSPGPYQTEILDAIPQLEEIAELDVEIVCNLDSSDISREIWADLARRIDLGREIYDGFVVIHGTDTMAFTANALSFALNGLGKPVVLTGAQRPLAEVRSDASRNLIDAITVATQTVPEVCVCFDGLLLRGCRSTKESARDYRAFASPGTPPLARLGVDLDFGTGLRSTNPTYAFLPEFSSDVRTLFASPALTVEQIENMAGANGVVLVSFGLGTVPALHGKTFDAISDLVKTGTPVVAITSSSGSVDFALYPNSRKLRDAGVLNGQRLGLESGIVKLMHGLRNFPELSDYLNTNIAGELG